MIAGRIGGALLGAAWIAGAAISDPLEISEAGRAALGAEIRAVLLEEPEILARALSPYGAEVAADRAMLGAAEPLLRDLQRARIGDGPQIIAVFFDPESERWPELESELKSLVTRVPSLSVVLHPRSEAQPLMEALQIDITPSYVLPDMILRGDVPVGLLPRYF